MRDNPGQDYADQRYYNVGTGRFNVPDPSKGSSPNDPTSWNKYAYVQGDPINFNDSSGLARCWLAASVYDPYAPEHSFAEVYCQSEGRTLEEYHSVVPFTGDEARLTKSFEETFGAALDLAEQDYSLGEAIARAKRAIQNTPSCRPLFSADFDPSSVLDHLRNGDAAYGKFSWEAMGAGGNVAEVRGYEVNYAAASSYTVNVVINSTGDGQWFNRTAWRATYGDRYSDAIFDAATIIHELGHVFENLFGSSTTKIVNDGGISAGN
jgi:RHS repeat-associated protein